MYRLIFRSLQFALLGVAVLFPSATQAQPYELKLDGGVASSWFGGDNRAGQNPRHVGTGQVMVIDANARIASVAFEFSSSFDLSSGGTGTGNAVTLVLHVRDENGQSLRRSEVDLDASYNGGWVTFNNIDLNVLAGTKLIMTMHMNGALDPATAYTNGIRADNNNPYADGNRCGKHGASDADMEDFFDWSCNTGDTWDLHFQVNGTIFTNVGTSDSKEVPSRVVLAQNYPNPFNPQTNITFDLPVSSPVKLSVFDMLGSEVRVIHDEVLPAGSHTATFDASALPSGVYFYHLDTSRGSVSGKMVLMK